MLYAPLGSRYIAGLERRTNGNLTFVALRTYKNRRGLALELWAMTDELALLAAM